jgi:hypothetical protein
MRQQEKPATTDLWIAAFMKLKNRQDHKMAGRS